MPEKPTKSGTRGQPATRVPSHERKDRTVTAQQAVELQESLHRTEPLTGEAQGKESTPKSVEHPSEAPERCDQRTVPSRAQENGPKSHNQPKWLSQASKLKSLKIAWLMRLQVLIKDMEAVEAQTINGENTKPKNAAPPALAQHTDQHSLTSTAH